MTPRLPPNPSPQIIDRLIEIGLTQAAGMGSGPVSWAEIAAWQVNTHVRLEPWEARLIRHLSVEYVAESHRAEDENRPPPWRTEPTAAERAADEAELRAVLG